MINKFEDINYRRHLIRARQYSNEWRACAFRGDTKTTENLPGATKELAIHAVKQKLEEAFAEQKAKRGADGFPTVDEVRAAFKVLEERKKISKGQEAMLTDHINAPDHILTATQLANIAGYSAYNGANRWYGQLGFDLAEELDWAPQEKSSEGKSIWTFTLATNADGNAVEEEIPGHWRWKLRPEIIAGWTK